MKERCSSGRPWGEYCTLWKSYLMQYWVWVVVFFFLTFPIGNYQRQREDTIPSMRCFPARPSWVGFVHLLCCQSLLGLGAPCCLPGSPSNTVRRALMMHKLPLKNLDRGKLIQEKEKKVVTRSLLGSFLTYSWRNWIWTSDLHPAIEEKLRVNPRPLSALLVALI